jgi:hypothetical protein
MLVLHWFGSSCSRVIPIMGGRSARWSRSGGLDANGFGPYAVWSCSALRIAPAGFSVDLGSVNGSGEVRIYVRLFPSTDDLSAGADSIATFQGGMA